MNTLYEINAEIAELTETLINPETGEIDEDVEKALEGLEMERTAKIEGLCNVYKNARAREAMYANEIKRLQGYKKQETAKMEWVKNYLANLAPDGFNGESVVEHTTRKDSVVEIYDFGTLPQEYLRFKDPEPDKTAIKKAIKNGETVTGARLIDSTSTTIK